MPLVENEVARDLISGTVGGCLGILVSQPFDVAKLRLQTADAGTSLRASTWRVMWDIARKEGGRALYRGLGPPIASAGLLNAVVFAGYNGTLRMLESVSPGQNKYVSSYIAGTLAGVCTLPFSVPVELVKCQQQVHISGTGLKATTVIKDIIARDGIMGLCRGWWITSLRDPLSFGVYFAVYEKIKDLFGENPSGVQITLAGGLTGVIAWWTVYPIDTVKSQIQTNRELSANPWRAIPLVYRSVGWNGLWRGWWACALRAFPLNGGVFLGYEFTMAFLS
eukprot:m.65587 g.65587  ORF g.65587 m.65587 type:complete len:279 (+) comp11745_c0_seq1:260-1096(+)